MDCTTLCTNPAIFCLFIIFDRRHLEGGFSYLQHSALRSSQIVKTSALQLLIYGCNFIQNSSLQLPCCLYTLFPVSLEEEIWDREVR